MPGARIDHEGRVAEVWSWLPAGEIEPEALAQIRNVGSLSCAVAVAVMPDCHKGYGMPIGTALATRDAVVPYAVGVDIGCGMIAFRTDLPAPSKDRVRAILDLIYASVPVGMPTRKDRTAGSHRERQSSTVLRHWMEERGRDFPRAREVRERADRQLGTLGSGNHFLEAQADGEGALWFMLHSGSRSLGKRICDEYHRRAVDWCARSGVRLPDRELAYLPTESDDGRGYLADMGFAMRFAEESRSRMETVCREAIGEVLGRFSVTLRVETHHNFAAAETHGGARVIVHRKGAVSTAGAVPVTIPGSMQTGSYIGRGIPNARALDTCAHGAGRTLGRNAVRRANAGVDIRAEMDAEGIVLVSPPHSDALDEAGRAYKDIESVMRYQADLVEPLVQLRPLGVVKG